MKQLMNLLVFFFPLTLFSIPSAQADSGFVYAIKQNSMIVAVLLLGLISWSVFIGLPLLKKAKQFFKGITGKIYLNKAASLLQTEYRKIALGAIYSEQQTAFINSLTTGLDKNMIHSRLGDWWGINSRQEALETLQYLAKKGFRFYTPGVLAALASAENQQARVLESYFSEPEDLHKAWSQLQNLKETLEELKADNIISNITDIKRLGSAGWDCGRLVFVARLCFDAKFITEQEAWSFITIADELAREYFRSWDMYAKSYVIGRAMWGGANSFNSGIASIADYLLKEPKSPWVQLKW